MGKVPWHVSQDTVCHLPIIRSVFFLTFIRSCPIEIAHGFPDIHDFCLSGGFHFFNFKSPYFFTCCFQLYNMLLSISVFLFWSCPICTAFPSSKDSKGPLLSLLVSFFSTCSGCLGGFSFYLNIYSQFFHCCLSLCAVETDP